MIIFQLGILDKLTTGDWIPTIDWGMLMGPIMSFLANFILFAIAGLLIYKYVILPLRFKDEVEIRRYGAEGNFVIVKDRGRFKRDRKTDEVSYKLLKNKNLSVPVFNGGDYYYSLEKGKKKLYMIQENEIDIKPIHPHELKPLDTPLSLPGRNMMINNLREIEKMFEKDSIMRQYLPYLVMIIMTVFFWLAFKSLMEGATTGFSQVATAAKELGDAIKSLQPFLSSIAEASPPPP